MTTLSFRFVADRGGDAAYDREQYKCNDSPNRDAGDDLQYGHQHDGMPNNQGGFNISSLGLRHREPQASPSEVHEVPIFSSVQTKNVFADRSPQPALEPFGTGRSGTASTGVTPSG
jgi:hypothetical protein